MEQNKTTQQIQIREKKVKSPEKYKLILSEQLESKIRMYCALSPEREWSGVMFYKFEGTFKEGITIYGNDMYLMDQGTAAHTEFDLNEPEITRYMVFEGLTDHCIALVHSHNRMASFFSEEDFSTLRQYGTEMNNFVSLVVNNEGKYVARVTRKCIVSGTKITELNGTVASPLFNTDRHEDSVLKGRTEETLDSTYLEYVDLVIERPHCNTIDAISRFGEVNNKCSSVKSTILPGEPFSAFGKTKEVQGRLWNDYDDNNYIKLPNNEAYEFEKLDWNKHGYAEWFNKLLNGSPFDSIKRGKDELATRYLRAFQNIKELENWFDIWFDYMVSIYDTSWIDEDDWGDAEEMLAYKVLADLEDYVVPQARYAEVMMDVINKRL